MPEGIRSSGNNIGRGEVTAFFCGSETEQTIPQSALRLTAPFAQGSHNVGLRRQFPLHKGAMEGRRRARSPASPYDKWKCHPTNHASPYGKGRCHEVTEGIRNSVFEKIN